MKVEREEWLRGLGDLFYWGDTWTSLGYTNLTDVYQFALINGSPGGFHV